MTIKASAWGNYTIPLGGLVPSPEEVVVVVLVVVFLETSGTGKS